MENTQTTEHRSGVYHDDICTLALEKKRKVIPKKSSPTQINRHTSAQNRKNGNDYNRDMIIVTDHDPKIMHALGNVVDLGPRNCWNFIRCKYIAQGLSCKRRFVLSYMYIYIPPGVPEPLVESKSFEENIIRNHGLPHRETPRKDGPNSPKLFLRSHISGVDIAGITAFR